jgi:hypothetical protein
MQIFDARLPGKSKNTLSISFFRMLFLITGWNWPR